MPTRKNALVLLAGLLSGCGPVQVQVNFGAMPTAPPLPTPAPVPSAMATPTVQEAAYDT